MAKVAILLLVTALSALAYAHEELVDGLTDIDTRAPSPPRLPKPYLGDSDAIEDSGLEHAGDSVQDQHARQAVLGAGAIPTGGQKKFYIKLDMEDNELVVTSGWMHYQGYPVTPTYGVQKHDAKWRLNGVPNTPYLKKWCRSGTCRCYITACSDAVARAKCCGKIAAKCEYYTRKYVYNDLWKASFDCIFLSKTPVYMPPHAAPWNDLNRLLGKCFKMTQDWQKVYTTCYV